MLRFVLLQNEGDLNSNILLHEIQNGDIFMKNLIKDLVKANVVNACICCDEAE